MALTAAQRKRLAELTPEQSYCLGTGRHDFPPVIPGRPLPKGVRVTRPHGIYQMERTCRICGRVLTHSHGSNGLRDYDVTPKYAGGGKGYDAEPGTGMSRSMYRDNLDRLTAETVKDAAKLERRQADPERRETTARIKELRKAVNG